jgi:hypothetical protein
MTYPLVNSMKLKQTTSSTLPPTSSGERYFHLPTGKVLQAPKPPTPEAVAKAQFVDKTYVWAGK